MKDKYEHPTLFLVNEDDESALALEIPKSLIIYWNELLALMPHEFVSSKLVQVSFYRHNASGAALQIMRSGLLNKPDDSIDEILTVHDWIVHDEHKASMDINFEYCTGTRTFKSIFVEEEDRTKEEKLLVILKEIVSIPGSSAILRNQPFAFVSDGKQWIRGDNYKDALEKAEQSKRKLKKLKKAKV